MKGKGPDGRRPCLTTSFLLIKGFSILLIVQQLQCVSSSRHLEPLISSSIRPSLISLEEREDAIESTSSAVRPANSRENLYKYGDTRRSTSATLHHVESTDKISSRSDNSELTRLWKFEVSKDKSDDNDDKSVWSQPDTLNSSEVDFYTNLANHKHQQQPPNSHNHGHSSRELDLYEPAPTEIQPRITKFYRPPHYDHTEQFLEDDPEEFDPEPVADARVLVRHSHKSHKVIHVPVYTPVYSKHKVTHMKHGGARPRPPLQIRRRPYPPKKNIPRPVMPMLLPKKRPLMLRPMRLRPHQSRHVIRHPPMIQHKAYAPAFISYGPIAATHGKGGHAQGAGVTRGCWHGHCGGNSDSGEGRYQQHQHSIEAPRYIPPKAQAPPLPPLVGRVVANYPPPLNGYIPPPKIGRPMPIQKTYLPPLPSPADTFGPPTKEFMHSPSFPKTSYWKDIKPTTDTTVKPVYGPPPTSYEDSFGFSEFKSPPKSLYEIPTPTSPAPAPSMLYIPISRPSPSPPQQDTHPPGMLYGHPMNNYGPPMSSFGQPPPIIGDPFPNIYEPKDELNVYNHGDVSSGSNPSDAPPRPRYKKRRRKKYGGQVNKPQINDDGLDHGYYDKMEEQLLNKKLRPPYKPYNPISGGGGGKGKPVQGQGHGGGAGRYRAEYQYDEGPEADEHYDNDYYYEDKDSYNEDSSPPQLLREFRPPWKHYRPPPSFNTNYNSPGLYMDPKIVDWAPYATNTGMAAQAKGMSPATGRIQDEGDGQISGGEEGTTLRSRPGGRRYRYKRNRRQKSDPDFTGTSMADGNAGLLKYSTLPESLETHQPDPEHGKYPRLTYDADASSIVASTKKAPTSTSTTPTSKPILQGGTARRRRPFMNPQMKRIINSLTTTSNASSSSSPTSFTVPLYSFGSLQPQKKTSLKPSVVMAPAAAAAMDSSTLPSSLELSPVAALSAVGPGTPGPKTSNNLSTSRYNSQLGQGKD